LWDTFKSSLFAKDQIFFLSRKKKKKFKKKKVEKKGDFNGVKK